MNEDPRDPALIRWSERRVVVVVNWRSVCSRPSLSLRRSHDTQRNNNNNSFSSPSLPPKTTTRKPHPPAQPTLPAASASPWWNDRPLGQGNSSSPSSPSSQLLTTPALLGGDAAWRPPPPLAFRDGSIVDALAGTPLDLHGFNWAGFNYIQYGMEFFEGLQEGGETATGDFATVVYRQQLLGFNLVRIPFRFASLFEEEEGDDKEAAYGGGGDGGGGEGGEERAGERLLARKRWRRPSRTLARRCRWTSRAALKKVLTNPSAPFYSRIDYDAIGLPKPVAPPAKPASYATRRDANGRGAGFKDPPECNWYLPDTSILDRLLFAVQYYVANGEEGRLTDWIGGGGGESKEASKGREGRKRPRREEHRKIATGKRSTARKQAHLQTSPPPLSNKTKQNNL